MDLLVEKPKGKELFQLIVGTYEEYLVGFSLNSDQKNKVKFYQKFTNHAHNGSVKAIACSSNGTLVSGGSDEICNLINVRKSQEMGNLIEHEGAITALEFYKNKFLFSASDDKTICVWNLNTVTCDKKLTGHKQSINSISVHPTGKLMLSAGRDKTIRTWNLIAGRLAFVTNLKESANLVKWSPEGRHFVLGYNKRIDVYDITTCGIMNTIEVDAGVSCIQYLDNDILIVGKENGELTFRNSLEKADLFTFKAHDRRVKDFVQIPVDLIPTGSYSNLLSTISSDGLIKLWNVDLAERKFELLAEHNVNCRLNCVTFFSNCKN